MNAKKSAILLITVSIIAALAMMVSSYLIQDAEQSQMIVHFIIAIWFIPFGYLTGTAYKTSCN